MKILKLIDRGVSDAGSMDGHVGVWVDGWVIGRFSRYSGCDVW